MGVTGYVIFLFLNIDFVLANSAEPDEKPQNAAFQPGLYCLSMSPFRGFQSKRIKSEVKSR